MNTGMPVVGVTADIREIEGGSIHAVREQYLSALIDCAGVAPVILPATGDSEQLHSLLPVLDGLLLTGAVSNVHPSLYGAEETAAHAPFDARRDATTMPLIPMALERGLPLLAICRGFQELNVALGGTLHPMLHERPGSLDHRRVQHPDTDRQYSPSHKVTFTPDGRFAEISETGELLVNSLHFQGIDRLAQRLAVEAVAPDGTIEAVRVKNCTGFAMATQWHPEYRACENAFSRNLFRAFGEAVTAHRLARLQSAAQGQSW